MRKWISSLGVVLLAGAVSGQTMLEYGLTSATGSSAGAAAGMKINQALDGVLSKVNDTTERAAKQTVNTPSRKSTLKTPAADGVVPDSSSRSQRGPAHRVARNEFPQQEVTPAAQIPEQPKVLATAESFAAIQSGAKRDDVMTKLGSAASGLSMPDDGKLIEVLHYRSADGKDLGTVRLTDGVVTSVEKAQ